MQPSSRSALLAAGLAAIAGLGSVATPIPTTPATVPLLAPPGRMTEGTLPPRTVSTSKAVLRHLHGGYASHHNGYQNGPGWTQAQVQRRARKARNVRRNRLAHRR